jgi:hypothetical protein
VLESSSRQPSVDAVAAARPRGTARHHRRRWLLGCCVSTEGSAFCPTRPIGVYVIVASCSGGPLRHRTSCRCTSTATAAQRPLRERTTSENGRASECGTARWSETQSCPPPAATSIAAHSS